VVYDENYSGLWIGGTNKQGLFAAMTTKLKKPKDRKRKFIGVVELRERWNNCSHMFIERKIKTDPGFPKVYHIGRHRFFDVEELEQYEQRCVVAR
jgi:hypothetical protein